jgi:hypothetical protein
VQHTLQAVHLQTEPQEQLAVPEQFNCKDLFCVFWCVQASRDSPSPLTGTFGTYMLPHRDLYDLAVASFSGGVTNPEPSSFRLVRLLGLANLACGPRLYILLCVSSPPLLSPLLSA